MSVSAGPANKSDSAGGTYDDQPNNTESPVRPSDNGEIASSADNQQPQHKNERPWLNPKNWDREAWRFVIEMALGAFALAGLLAVYMQIDLMRESNRLLLDTIRASQMNEAAHLTVAKIDTLDLATDSSAAITIKNVGQGPAGRVRACK